MCTSSWNTTRQRLEIWHYAFTEMVNNAIDHSGGSTIRVHIKRTAADTQIFVRDNGVGIFKKIQSALGLLDERHAILELSKGKLTTDPDRHTGQGIFFTSRMVDSFDLFSGGVYFNHEFGDDKDWIFEQSIPGLELWSGWSWVITPLEPAKKYLMNFRLRRTTDS